MPAHYGKKPADKKKPKMMGGGMAVKKKKPAMMGGGMAYKKPKKK
jgi:hypothetical protein